MQREPQRRGFTLYVVLELDFSGCVRGYTEITVIPVTADLKTINLHCRQCVIHNVQVAKKTADFVHHDPLASISIAKPDDVHLFPEFKRKLYSALSEGDEGELSIAIPEGIQLKQSNGGFNGVAASVASHAGTPEPYTPTTPVAPGSEFGSLTLTIEYSLRHPKDGLEFVLPTEAYPYRAPHMYTTPSCPDAARCWVPCVDNIWERCTWEFEFVVPKYLDAVDEGEDELAMQVDREEGEYPVVVVCSGELVEQVAHPHNSNKTIFLYSLAVPATVQHISFAAGPFHVLTLPVDPQHSDSAPSAGDPSSQPQMHAFCLPGLESSLTATTSFFRSAMTFYTNEYGSYPFSSHKLVFVDEMPGLAQRFDSATLSIVSGNLLHGDDAIDQVFETRHSLAHALACQWVGINILQKTWADTWLVNGLGLYITGLYIRWLFGNNEYRFRLRKDMDRIVGLDSGGMPPICRPTYFEPPDSATIPFINLKAPLVLHILDRRLAKSGTALGLSRVLPKVFLSAISGEMTNNALSTHSFLRTCRKVSGVELRSFAEQWIYGSGCPRFAFQATFNRKKMAVEITMTQEAPAYLVNEKDPIAMATLKPVQLFEGQMTVRIHEADGTPYEHVLDIRSPTKKYEVPFNTKYKRVRRNTKRFLARQAAAAAAAAGDTEAAEDIGMIDMGFGLGLWEDEKERARWKVADWTEEDEHVMSGATYEWIRLDADFEWITMLAFDQPDFMWVSQLQRDRDVVAQLEAVHALARQPTAIVSSTLTKTALVTNYFFRVRVEAALALINCATPALGDIGLFHLFKIFTKYCYEPQAKGDPLTGKFVPKPNDFSDFAEYFLRKSLITAISRYRDESGKPGPIVRQFLIDQLRYNDNSTNPYSDALYVSTIISALGCSLLPSAIPEQSELLRNEWRPEQDQEDIDVLQASINEVERYRDMDRLLPSPHNVVTIAILEWYLMMMMGNLLPNDPKLFLAYTREGNYMPVRLAAFDGLLLMKWCCSKNVIRYIFAVLANDSSRVVRRRVAFSVCESLAILSAVGEIKNSSKDTEPFLIEEDHSQPMKSKQLKKGEVDALLKALRKEVGRSASLRECIMPIMLSPTADHEVRWCMLKLADFIYRPAEESLPKISIHLPPTPVTEVPPSLPPVKLVAAAVVKPEPPIRRPSRMPAPSLPTSTPMSLPKLKLSTTIPRVETTASPQLPQIGLPDAPTNGNLPAKPVDRIASPIPTAKSVAFQEPKPRSPKKKMVPKARTGGMSAHDVHACKNALKKLLAYKHSALFRIPVDPVRDLAPGYFDKIKHPMDLSSMSAKLDAGKYRDRFQFKDDFDLMINNARLYNAPGTYAFGEAVALEGFFEKLWEKTNKTLEAAEPSVPPPVAPPAPAPTPSTSTAFAAEPTSKPRAPVTKAPEPPAPARAPSPRPALKLKVAIPIPPRSESPAPSEKTKSKGPKPLKLKVTTAPSPSIDDVDDLLGAEIEAIEAERGSSVKKHKGRSRDSMTPNPFSDTLPPSTIINKVPSSAHKAKRPSEHSVGSAARPSPAPKAPAPTVKVKKQVHDSAAPVAGPSVHVIKPAPEPIKVSKPAPDGPPKAAGQPKAPPAPSRPPKTSAPAAVVSTSTKGKAKETADAPPPAPIDVKKCKEVLRTLTKLPEAFIFLEPVDAVALGCPTYYEEIKNPMDFGTMGTKLSKGTYVTMDQFAADVELVLNNCRQFNPIGTQPQQAADAVERVFRKEWAKVSQKKLPFAHKRALQGVLNKIKGDICSFWFRDPVDPVLLNIPDYYTIVDERDARDLGTIRANLDADKYDSVEAVEADVRLMIRNAHKFNGALSEVGIAASEVGKQFAAGVKDLKGGQTKKRKEKEKERDERPSPGHSMTKKIKLG